MSAEPEFTPDDWQTVSEDEVDETKIVFDTIGDEFIGEYIGPRVIETEDGKFTQYRFRKDGVVYFTNAGYSLMRGMQKVRIGQITRLLFKTERDTGQDSPMRIMQVDVAKRRPTASK